MVFPAPAGPTNSTIREGVMLVTLLLSSLSIDPIFFNFDHLCFVAVLPETVLAHPLYPIITPEEPLLR